MNTLWSYVFVVGGVWEGVSPLSHSLSLSIYLSSLPLICIIREIYYRKLNKTDYKAEEERSYVFTNKNVQYYELTN